MKATYNTVENTVYQNQNQSFIDEYTVSTKKNQKKNCSFIHLFIRFFIFSNHSSWSGLLLIFSLFPKYCTRLGHSHEAGADASADQLYFTKHKLTKGYENEKT